MKALTYMLLATTMACKAPESGSPQDTSGEDSNGGNPCAPDDPRPEPEDTGNKEDTSTEPEDTSTEPEDTSDTDVGPEAGPEARPDFYLEDVNPSSPRMGEQVSPRDYLEKVSGWYFTHAT